MRRQLLFAVASLALLAACGTPTPKAPVPATAAIPASLAPFGDGYPNPGNPCRRLSEAPATADWLDDSAILVGCPTDASAAAAGGRVVATVEGVRLVSIATPDANAGMTGAKARPD